ncbi:STAS domain-containing protein [Lutibaculum baratangense]|uniref:RsbR, positive regulator of sigma-B n=1 Tax=Lutibaculum baratangense AMV1 TaxID=631454 RepID=V4RDS5_9HYPH|nr:STAS domain-containing protein [Lutibaculum baratangense]ESR23524.1 RsbR, positive regulator of sigma-B [Lutibaculum baratangense AMV1]
MASENNVLAETLQSDFEGILTGWLQAQAREGAKRTDLVSTRETEKQSRDLLTALARASRDAVLDDGFDFANPVWDQVRETLEEITESRTQRGVSPTEIGVFVTSMKRPIFERLRSKIGPELQGIEDMWNVSRVIDQLSLYAIESLVTKREAVIERQQSEMTEVSAPVVRIWDRIVTVPLIGTLDSFRAQTVMENLLSAIVQWEAEVAIIDITGVSTVDTLVAQHLLKTAAAVRLMGAQCVICGISPKIAQTIVNLGVELPNVTTRIDLQSGLEYAFKRIGVSVDGH